MADQADTEKRTESISESPAGSTFEKPSYAHRQTIDPAKENINAKLANPLAGIPHDQLMRDGAAFARKYKLDELENEFSKGAVIAQNPSAFEQLDFLTDEERGVLRTEQTHRWKQPFTLYW